MAGSGAVGNGHSIRASSAAQGPPGLHRPWPLSLQPWVTPHFFLSLFHLLQTWRVSREGYSKLWEIDWGIYFVSLSEPSVEVVKGVDSVTKQLRA